MTAECGPSFMKRTVCSTAQRISLTRVNPEVFENITEGWKPVLALAATNIHFEMETQPLTGAYASVNSHSPSWNTDCVL